MISELIVYGTIIVLVLIILYNLYAILRILFNKEDKSEDKSYKVKKNLFDFLMTILRNFRRFIDLGQYGKHTVNPQDVAFASALDHTIANLSKADPALTAKKEIAAQIESAVKVLEAALENAMKHKSLEARNYIAECFQELQLIQVSLDQQESFSQVKERIRIIQEQAQTLADATTFEDAGSDTGEGPAPNFKGSSQKKTYYEILGVNMDATVEEIKKSYRDLANKYHPDKYEHLAEDMKKEASRRFTEINEAYQVLSDPQKRVEYDKLIA